MKFKKRRLKITYYNPKIPSNYGILQANFDLYFALDTVTNINKAVLTFKTHTLKRAKSCLQQTS